MYLLSELFMVFHPHSSTKIALADVTSDGPIAKRNFILLIFIMDISAAFDATHFVLEILFFFFSNHFCSVTWLQWLVLGKVS